MDNKNLPNCQTTASNVAKTLPVQPICCPWTTTAPIASSSALKGGLKSLDLPSKDANLGIQTLLPKPTSCQHYLNNRTIDGGKVINTQLSTESLACPSIQQSSQQFFHFLRLMQLFPDVHPATLHTVLSLCKNDFFCAVDKLLYAKRCKQFYNNRQNAANKNLNPKQHRYQPYPSQNSTATPATPQRTDAAPKSLLKQNSSVTITDQGESSTADSKASLCANENVKADVGVKMYLPKCKLKNNNETDNSTPADQDFQTTSSTQCEAAVRGLLSSTEAPEDLSNHGDKLSPCA